MFLHTNYVDIQCSNINFSCFWKKNSVFSKKLLHAKINALHLCMLLTCESNLLCYLGSLEPHNFLDSKRKLCVKLLTKAILQCLSYYCRVLCCTIAVLIMYKMKNIFWFQFNICGSLYILIYDWYYIKF